MIIGAIQRVLYTVEVEQEHEPSVGNQYQDQMGYIWRIREVHPTSRARTMFRNPQPTFPVWDVQFEGEPDRDPRLRYLDELDALYEKRPIGALYRGSVTPNTHLVKLKPVLGFGTVVKDDTKYSWMFRVTPKGSYVLRVGPLVSHFNDFKGPVAFEREGQVEFPRDPKRNPKDQRDFLPYLPWDLVTNLLNEFDGAMTRGEMTIEPEYTLRVNHKGESVRAITRKDAIIALRENEDYGDSRLRNYEIEAMLKDRFPAPWVVWEVCPFNGKFCAWGTIVDGELENWNQWWTKGESK